MGNFIIESNRIGLIDGHHCQTVPPPLSTPSHGAHCHALCSHAVTSAWSMVTISLKVGRSDGFWCQHASMTERSAAGVLGGSVGRRFSRIDAVI